MSQVIVYRAKSDHVLDCGDTVKAGDEIVIIKTFICPGHASARAPYSKADEPRPKPAEEK